MKKLSFLTPPHQLRGFRVYMVDGNRSSIATNTYFRLVLEPSIRLPNKPLKSIKTEIWLAKH
jgi:hypothetical protein